jgi:hypothetical protein
LSEGCGGTGASAVSDALSFDQQADNVAAVAAKASLPMNSRRFQKIASGVTADSGSEQRELCRTFITNDLRILDKKPHAFFVLSRRD